jgi:hypothetical protein
MAMTYEQAAELAYRAGAAAWDPEWGTFCFDDREITEDNEVYVFTSGPREAIVDHDPTFMRYGGGLPVVSKLDGGVKWHPWVVLMTTRPGLQSRRNPAPVYFR